MPIADFEEKEYEIPLYVELADGSPYVWSPGQVLEKRLGLDGTQFTRNSTFWRIVGRSLSTPSGIALDLIAPTLNIFHRRLPSFRCNLMLQVKRPNYLKRRTLGYSGNSPYYRFTIDNDQQSVLANLAKNVGNRAYVGYASPAFSKSADLYWNTIHSSLISNSIFINAIPLTGHKHLAYLGPGTSGHAYSEQSDINEEPFLTVLEKLAHVDNEWKSSNEHETSQNMATEALGDLNEKIRAVCDEESKAKNTIARDTLLWMSYLDSSWGKEIHSAIRHFSNIQLFCSIYSLLWFTVG